MTRVDSDFVTPGKPPLATRPIAPWRRDIIAYWFALRHRGEVERDLARRNIKDAQWVRRRLA